MSDDRLGRAVRELPDRYLRPMIRMCAGVQAQAGHRRLAEFWRLLVVVVADEEGRRRLETRDLEEAAGEVGGLVDPADEDDLEGD